jgi:hypothetical protein
MMVRVERKRQKAFHPIFPIQRKKPDVAVTPGFPYSSEICGRASPSHWSICRWIGESTAPTTFFAIQPWGSHNSFSQTSSPTKICLPVIYQTDATQSEMVHEKS